MASYLVLLTDRVWKSEWQPHEQDASISKGDTITINSEKWDVLNEWVDLDDVHLVFCVKHPKSEQHPPPGVTASAIKSGKVQEQEEALRRHGRSPRATRSKLSPPQA